MRDQSKIQEIADRLEAEDPELFMELVQFIESQQERKNGLTLRQCPSDRNRSVGMPASPAASPAVGIN